MDLKQLLDSIGNIEVEYLSLREVHTKSIGFAVRNDLLEGMNTSFDHGLMVEVMVHGQLGYTALNSFEKSDVKAAALRARTLAIEAKKHGLHPFSLKERPIVVGDYKSPAKSGFENFNLKETQDLLMDLSKAMNVSEKIVDRVGYFSLIEMQSRMVSNIGSDINQTLIRSSLGLSCTAVNGNESQHRSYGHDHNSQWGLDNFNKSKFLTEAKRIADEAIELLDSEDCPTETMDLILAPDQMYLQIHESIGHPLELDRILGDERNYAGWSFIKPSDFNHLQYGSKLMNVTFDPTVVGQNASYFADDIGARASREFLIKDGLLLRGLGSLESQNRLGLEGVSSQRSTNWNRAPIDRMANVNLEAGSSSVDEMIKNVKRGVFMFTNRSWSIDDYRNKFQFGCEYGKLIEDGKLTKTVKNPNYRGITTPFWNSLKMVGDINSYEIGGLANCGKGEPNQVIFVGHASPVCLFSNIEVFGGGKK
jgi:predicted Zn-dependent protease